MAEGNSRKKPWAACPAGPTSFPIPGWKAHCMSPVRLSIFEEVAGACSPTVDQPVLWLLFCQALLHVHPNACAGAIL